VTTYRTANWGRWKAQLVACLLVAAALTAFLMHLGAADPWIGGLAVPATIWIVWLVVDIAWASRRRARAKRETRD